jgi:hypothetical protein
MENFIVEGLGGMKIDYRQCGFGWLDDDNRIHTVAGGDEHEELDLADHIVDLFQVHFGTGAPNFEGGYFLFEDDDVSQRGM